jgi:branched-chain amino acid transport system substrate-binding protein
VLERVSDQGSHPPSRRRLFAGVCAPVLAALSIGVAACGSSGGSTSTSGGSSTAATSGASTATGGVNGDQINKILRLDGKNSGKGMKIKLGALLALTGPGSFYGTNQGNGIKLAAAQIKAAGGPDFELQFKDHKSANAQAGVQAGREFGIDHVPVVLTSYVADIGAMFPALAQYKMLGLDGGGGTSDFGQGKPYFWGMRAIEPDDDFIGALQYWKATDPKIKRVSLVYFDQGPVNKVVIGNFNKAVAATGMQVANAVSSTIGQTDFSAPIAKLKSANPDAVFLFGTGVDPGYFMKQYVAAGVGAPVIGSEYITDAAKVAGPAFDKYMFATDWFNPAKPANNWSKLFLDSYQKRFGTKPEINSANYYEDTFAVWDLVRRVLAKGQSITGENLQNALIADPKFQSIYGGSGAQLGEIALDTKTHTVTERPLQVYKSNGGNPIEVASFDLGGANFQLTKEARSSRSDVVARG